MTTVGLLLERNAYGGATVPEVVTTAPAADYDACFPELHRRAYGAAYRLLGDRAEAEDVAQEALTRAYLHWSGIEGYATAWVVRVSSNLAIGTWRKRRRLVHGNEAADPGADGLEAALPDHLALRAALAALPKRQREVVVLRHLFGFSERETALTLGCSAGSVKQHASRGLQALRLRLGVPDDVDGGGS